MWADGAPGTAAWSPAAVSLGAAKHVVPSNWWLGHQAVVRMMSLHFSEPSRDSPSAGHSFGPHARAARQCQCRAPAATCTEHTPDHTVRGHLHGRHSTWAQRGLRLLSSWAAMSADLEAECGCARRQVLRLRAAQRHVALQRGHVHQVVHLIYDRVSSLAAGRHAGGIHWRHSNLLPAHFLLSIMSQCQTCHVAACRPSDRINSADSVNGSPRRASADSILTSVTVGAVIAAAISPRDCSQPLKIPFQAQDWL